VGESSDRELSDLGVVVLEGGLEWFDRRGVAQDVQGLRRGPLHCQAGASVRLPADLFVGQHDDQRRHRPHVPDRLECSDRGDPHVLVGVHHGLG